MTVAGNEFVHSIFISDLHLCSTRPHITAQFTRFLETTAAQAEALYILGDLFEYWAGDDDVSDPHHQQIINALMALSKSGVRVFLIHGNRDFLLGEEFAHACGLKILNDPAIINLYGKKTLISHGDALCTDDDAYQTFRNQVRNLTWQKEFLAHPLAARKAWIESLRQRSEQEKSAKAMSIMDVNAHAVESLIRVHDYPSLFIHGHTHRPALHRLNIDNHPVDRWVLGDWYDQGSYLVCDIHGCKAVSLGKY